MSKSLISTGINPNDGNGDTLLAGATKVNSNFNEIYSALGNGTDINIGVGKTVISTNSLGNVGVGTTNPTSKLQVQGDVLVSGIATISVNSSTDALRITQTGTGNALVVEDETNPDSSPFVIKGGGYGWVGIGTTNPREELHLQSVDPIIRFVDEDASTNNRNWNIGANNEIFYFQALNDSGEGGGQTFRFTRSSGEIVSFEGRKAANTWFVVNNSTQRVGIGTTNPTSKLEVIGNMLVTGITTVGLGSTSTPPSNSQLSFELTSDTNLRIKVRGTDGVLRSANITLA